MFRRVSFGFAVASGMPKTETRNFHEKPQIYSVSRYAPLINARFSYERGMFDITLGDGKLIVNERDITHCLPKETQNAEHFDLVINQNKKISLNGYDFTRHVSPRYEFSCPSPSHPMAGN